MPSARISRGCRGAHPPDVAAALEHVPGFANERRRQRRAALVARRQHHLAVRRRPALVVADAIRLDPGAPLGSHREGTVALVVKRRPRVYPHPVSGAKDAPRQVGVLEVAATEDRIEAVQLLEDAAPDQERVAREVAGDDAAVAQRVALEPVAAIGVAGWTQRCQARIGVERGDQRREEILLRNDVRVELENEAARDSSRRRGSRCRRTRCSSRCAARAASDAGATPASRRSRRSTRRPRRRAGRAGRRSAPAPTRDSDAPRRGRCARGPRRRRRTVRSGKWRRPPLAGRKLPARADPATRLTRPEAGA